MSVVELHSQAFVCNVNCTSDLQNCPESSYYKICNVHSAFLICDSAHNPSLGKIDHNTGIGIDRPLSENLKKKNENVHFRCFMSTEIHNRVYVNLKSNRAST